MKEDIQPLTLGQQQIMDRIGAPEIAIGDACKGIPHDKREQRGQAVSGDAEGQVPTPALDEQRVSREAIRPPGSGVDELEYWRANAMHYHGLCVALEDEIDCWNLAIDGKNAYIRRHTEWLEKANDELRDLHTTLSAFTNCASDGRNWRMMWQRLCEQREALRAKAEEYREGWVKCCFNASDAHTLNRRMREFLHAYFIDGVLRFGERDGKPWTYREEARELLGIELPELEQAPTREGGGGGGFVDLPPAEEKYNRILNDPSSDKPNHD